MNPIVAMAHFLTSNAVSLTSLEYQYDPTVRLLFELSKELIMKESDPKNKFTESMRPLLENIKRKIDTDVDNEEIPEAIAKKVKGYINESFATINKPDQTQVDLTKASEPSQAHKNDNKYTEDDIMFIKSKSNTGKRRNWRRIY